ncbi:hypothetical protein ACHAPJ_009284 [Fusarium lateritium]
MPRSVKSRSLLRISPVSDIDLIDLAPMEASPPSSAKASQDETKGRATRRNELDAEVPNFAKLISNSWSRQQVDPPRGTTRRREDVMEPRKLARTSVSDRSFGAEEAQNASDSSQAAVAAAPLSNTARDNRISRLEAQLAAQQAETKRLENKVAAEEARTSRLRASNDSLLDSIEALEGENLALKQEVRRLKSHQD